MFPKIDSHSNIPANFIRLRMLSGTFATVKVNNMVDGRFATVEGEHLKSFLGNVDALNTKRTTMTGVKLFRTYLTSKNLSADFGNFSLEDLDTRLASFYIEMRNKEGQLCNKSTLISYRHGLQRHLEKKCKTTLILRTQQVFGSVHKPLRAWQKCSKDKAKQLFSTTPYK